MTFQEYRLHITFLMMRRCHHYFTVTLKRFKSVNVHALKRNRVSQPTITGKDDLLNDPLFQSENRIISAGGNRAAHREKEVSNILLVISHESHTQIR